MVRASLSLPALQRNADQMVFASTKLAADQQAGLSIEIGTVSDSVTTVQGDVTTLEATVAAHTTELADHETRLTDGGL